MSAESMIFIIVTLIASMAVIFLFSVLKENEVTPEKLLAIVGEENITKIKEAKNDKEIETIIKSLTKKQKSKLKILLESQDIRDAVNAFKVYFRDEQPNVINK